MLTKTFLALLYRTVGIVVNKDEKEARKEKDIKLFPIPTLQSSQQSSKQYFINGFNIEVTSVDITTHGCFIVVGCSNGMILLYDTAVPSRCPPDGKLIGHIKAKGLHTNLLLHVQLTDDCRFCFAGVMKGSSELLAIDLGKLPLPWTDALSATSPRNGKAAPIFNDVEIPVYCHADAKLRGFGAAARVFPYGGQDKALDKYRASSVYRLACGRGIKNVHVWQFTPGNKQATYRNGASNLYHKNVTTLSNLHNNTAE